VVYGSLNWSTQIQGVTPSYFEARDWPVDEGRPILQEDVDGATKVALLGQTPALNLFGESDPMGQIIPHQEGARSPSSASCRVRAELLGSGSGRSDPGPV
jgi:hypothetical protein